MKKISNYFTDLKKRVFPVYMAETVDESGIAPEIVTYYKPESSIAEEYRIIRMNFLSVNSGRSLKTLLVTSAVRDEGKTTTAVNLAVTFAQNSDKPVLLLDADLRKGTIPQLLGLNSNKGLSNLLKEDAPPESLESLIQETRIPNLFVLSAGDIGVHDSKLLQATRRKELFKTLKERFEHIIIDSPPVIPVTDARILSSDVDGVILAVGSGKANRDIIQQTCSLLEQMHANILGFVFVGAEYFYPKYKYYYYHYGEKNE